MTSQNTKLVIAAFCVLYLFQPSLSLPRPHNSWTYGSIQPQFIDECLTNEEVLTLCQTCAKQTKSNIVYPMCCEEREEARTWCEKYMGYGKRD